MANNTYLKIKKGQYESPADNIDGLLVFDTLINTIRLGGTEFGPLSGYTPSNNISTTSSDRQVATTKGVYDAIQEYIKPLYEELVSKSTTYGGPTRVPAPYVITDNDSTAITLDVLQANTVYVYNSPLVSLNIEKVIDSALESTIYFKTDSDTTFSFTVPQGVYKINNFIFDTGEYYCLSIKNSVISCDKIMPYVKEDTLIFGSSQLQGGYIDTPEIIESAEENPVINDTKPNAVYKFGTCDSITLSNIPSNSLETLVYWTSDSNTTLYLSGDETTTLKITAGSDTVYKNGKYVMAIKDGVIVITKLINA